MLPLELYEATIRSKICGLCIDRSPSGGCAIHDDPNLTCVLETHLPKIVDVIENFPEADLVELEAHLRARVCEGCRQDTQGRCVLRDHLDCALDRYFPIVCLAIEDVRNSLRLSERFSEKAARLTETLFLQHQRLHASERDLWRVAKAYQVVPTGENLRRLRNVVADFRTLLMAHIQFEEGDGFMTPILEMRPTLSPRVEGLEQEHKSFQQEVDSIMQEMDDLKENQTAEDVPDRVLGLLDRLHHHEEMENSLVLDVFTQDIGNKD